MPGGLNVVIPVHNGAAVLAGTIDSLMAEGCELLNVTVVVNGSSDDSISVAQEPLARLSRAGARTRIVHVPQASRAAALNAGDAFAEPDAHHLYLDQDARLSAGGLRRLAEALDDGAHFVGARAAWRSASTAVLRAMAAWNALPYVVRAPATAGMYAVSARGRRRWPEWPAHLPDDKFARLNFLPQERRRLDDVEYSVLAPADFASLVRARTRYATSNQRLRATRPELASRDTGRGLRNLAAFRSAPIDGLAILATAEVAARLRARP